uniref:putative 2OG-Fe(II) oxygenase n=1 Tax=uncultured Sphingomonas sp. TaxID=158754 RepID=UPI0025D9206C|nr:putative 2OG-Fe(II) oxygenase [uncultured Sphingomonas sp.]
MTQHRSDAAALAEIEARARRCESEQRLQDAARAYDDALRLCPSAQSSAEGRARIAIQLREAGAVEHCARALAFHDQDPSLQFQMIFVAASELGNEAIPLLERFLKSRPGHVAAHELLAELRAQAGAGDRFTDDYLSALEHVEDNKALLFSYWNVLSRSGRHLRALDSMEDNRALFAGERRFALLEISIAGHAGLTERVGQLLDELPGGPDLQLARAQHKLQTGHADEAAKLLEAIVAREPTNLTAWALLEPSWRLLEDQRHDWLACQPGLYGSSELDLSSAELASLADVLRNLHRARAQPIGQSVRGGTQTSGNLFMREEAELQRLTQALARGIRRFVGGLPPADPTHPLLRHRNSALTFGSSWSVRLTGGGYHAAHFHPGGVLSSACYISLPDRLDENGSKEGWLEIGRPPEELKLDLPPLASFEPAPGRLVLFPSYLFHGTRPFRDGERLTVAFDVAVGTG